MKNNSWVSNFLALGIVCGFAFGANAEKISKHKDSDGFEEWYWETRSRGWMSR